MNKTFKNFDNPIYQDTDSYRGGFTHYEAPYMNSIKYRTVSCEYFSLMLNDGTTSDFSDCRVRDGLQGVEILTNDNTLVFYFHDAIIGYTYRAKPYDPQKID